MGWIGENTGFGKEVRDFFRNFVAVKIRLLDIFVLLVSFKLLPPWAELMATLIPIINVLRSVGKLIINLKSVTRMKTSIMRIVYKAKGVWNTVGSAD